MKLSTQPVEAKRRKLRTAAKRAGCVAVLTGLAGCEQPETPSEALAECNEYANEAVDKYENQIREAINQNEEENLRSCQKMTTEKKRNACKNKVSQKAIDQRNQLVEELKKLRKKLLKQCKEIVEENIDALNETNEKRAEIKKNAQDTIDEVAETAAGRIEDNVIGTGKNDDDEETGETESLVVTSNDDQGFRVPKAADRAKALAANAVARNRTDDDAMITVELDLTVDVTDPSTLSVETTRGEFRFTDPNLGKQTSSITARGEFDRQGDTLTATSIDGTMTTLNFGGVDSGTSVLGLSSLVPSCGTVDGDQMELSLAIDLENDFLNSSLFMLDLEGPVRREDGQITEVELQGGGDMQNLFPTELESIPITSFHLKGIADGRAVTVSIANEEIIVPTTAGEPITDVGLRICEAINESALNERQIASATFEFQALNVFGVDPHEITINGQSPALFRGTLAQLMTAVSENRGIPLDGDPSTSFEEVIDCVLAPAPGANPERECYEASTTRHLGVSWELPVDHGNEIQTDSFAFDLGFYTEQCRHNDGVGLNNESVDA